MTEMPIALSAVTGRRHDQNIDSCAPVGQRGCQAVFISVNRSWSVTAGFSAIAIEAKSDA